MTSNQVRELQTLRDKAGPLDATDARRLAELEEVYENWKNPKKPDRSIHLAPEETILMVGGQPTVVKKGKKKG